MKDPLTIECGPLPSSARVMGFVGDEALSRLYRFDIWIEVPTDDSVGIDLAAVVAQPVKLTYEREGADPYFFRGIAEGFELLREVSDGRAVFRLTMVPLLWKLTQTRHSRIFTDKKLPEIIETILKDAGLTTDDFELKLGSYPQHEHVCQYRESDFAFLSRWMERDGIYYYFDHTDAGAKLVIADAKSAHESSRSAPLPYHPITGDDATSGEHLHSFTSRHAALPAKVALKDYDYLKPTLEVEGEAEVDGQGELHEYGRRFFTPSEGKRLAGLEAQALLSRQAVFHAKGGATHLRSGYFFELEQHPRSAFNQKYLVTELRHSWNTAAGTRGAPDIRGLDPRPGYHVELTAIAHDVQFRPARVSRWPRVAGVENALVDGPADSEYAQLDDHGRYHVKFHFDESDLSDGKASTWVRMLQPHAGNPEGFHFPLRKGTEVMVIFLGGDPDRPMIAGAIPNLQTPSPVTSSNDSQNVIHTGGNTRIEIEDKDGAQYIDISTPPKNTFLHMGEPHGGHSHYVVANTEGDCLFQIGSNQDIEVGGDLTEHVAGDVVENYDNDQDTTVGGDWTVKVGGDWDTTVAGDVTLEAGGDWDSTIAGDVTLEAGGDWDATISGDVTLEAGGDWDATISGDVTLTAGGDWDATIGGSASLKTGADVSWTVGAGVSWGVAGAITIKAPSVTINTPKWEVKSPDEHWIAAAVKHILGEDTEVKGIKKEVVGAAFGVCGLKTEIVGISTAATGLKLESVGVIGEIKGTEINDAGVSLGQKALRVLTCGLYTVT
jgi:type VI secretion system secreted protein VgrG